MSTVTRSAWIATTTIVTTTIATLSLLAACGGEHAGARDGRARPGDGGVGEGDGRVTPGDGGVEEGDGGVGAGDGRVTPGDGGVGPADGKGGGDGAGGGQVWTYPVPKGAQLSSPDYEVRIESAAGKSHPAFVHYSYGLDEYQKYKVAADKSLVPDGPPANYKNKRDTVSHSTAIFSFSGKIKVYVTVKPNAKHITLPLKSAKILPSSYQIPCKVIDGKTIVFELDRPEKVVVMPNYQESWKTFASLGVGHVPIQSWKSSYAVESKKSTFHATNLISKLTEGYRNPLFVIALPPEQNVPDATSPDTLVVQPGASVTQSQLDTYKVVWFAPGVHDLSKLGTSPGFAVMVKPGQTVYLQGGSYVMARFRKYDNKGPGACSILGRGMISGAKHKWTTSAGGQVYRIDSVVGVSITDRSSFALEWSTQIKDVSLLGAWHGNNDGPDFLDNCLIENCLLQAHDDNLKLNHNSRAKHLVIWQQKNAHPIMVKEMRSGVTFSSSVVEDVDIVAYFYDAHGDNWSRLSHGAIACVTGSDMNVNNFMYKNIRIEAPYLYRLVAFYNLDTVQPWVPGWFIYPTSEKIHTRINGVVFEKITVTSPLILYRSLLGSAYDNSLSNVSFVDVKINGTKVTGQNKDTFFEIEYDRIKGLAFQ